MTKVLASRLKLVMGPIVSKYRNAFVKEQQILDCSLVENEIIDSKLSEGVNGLVVKIDLMKAYDHVSWNFLEWVLQKMGFGEKWRKRVCVNKARFSILIYGSPRGFIKGSRGLRQGKTLSPFFF